MATGAPPPLAFVRFLERFEPDRMPFCLVGLRLLYALHQQRPDLYESAREYGFAHFDDPAYQTSPTCRALIEHVAACERCQAC